MTYTADGAICMFQNSQPLSVCAYKACGDVAMRTAVAKPTDVSNLQSNVILCNQIICPRSVQYAYDCECMQNLWYPRNEECKDQSQQ